MNIEDNKLYISEKIDYEDCDELINLSNNVEEIVVEANDIHPAIFQLLLVLSKTKNIIVEDEFNKRFFENLKIND